MKNANKRLMISLVALVIAIALAATTTFAWFTMDTTPEINNIDLRVTVQDGLYVSLSGADGDYRTNVDVSDEALGQGLNLQAITLNKPNALNEADAFHKIMDGTTVTAANSNAYYVRDIHIRSQSQYNIHVNDIKIRNMNDQYHNITAWRNLTAEDLGFTNAPADALLFPEATDSTGEDAAGDPYADTDILVPQGKALPVRAVVENSIRVGFAVDNTMVKVFNPKAGEGWEAAPYAGTFHAAHDYFKTVTVMSTAHRTTFDSMWASPNYSAILVNQTQLGSYNTAPEGQPVLLRGNTEDNLILGSTSIVDVEGVPTTVINGGLDDTRAADNGWYNKTIKVYIWVEGTDPDSFNEILKSTFTVDITLSGEYKAGT